MSAPTMTRPGTPRTGINAGIAKITASKRQAKDGDTDWHEDSRCRTTDPDLFFETGVLDIKAAKSICGACPVWETCLTDALDHDERYGVRGGLSEGDRKKLRRWRNGTRPTRVNPAGTPPDPAAADDFLAEHAAAMAASLRAADVT